MHRSFLALVFLTFCPILVAQQALNNDSVIKLVKAGLSDDLIISTIDAQKGIYDTSADGLIALKGAGVSDKVVSAMVAKAAAPIAAAPVAAPPPPPLTSPVPPFRSTDGRVRIYVTDHPMFESTGIVRASGDRHGASAAGVSHMQAGDDPRTVEIQADMLKVCPAFVLASNNPDRADYVLIFRRRGGSRSSMFAFRGLTGLAFAAGMKVDGASLFENNGDMVYATKQTTVEKSIQDICLHVPAPQAVQTAVPAPILAPIPPPPPPPAN
jgi:hypothetical protein